MKYVLLRYKELPQLTVPLYPQFPRRFIEEIMGYITARRDTII